MELLQKLEAKLVELLDKKAPFKLSANARKSLAEVAWVLALVFGVLQLWAAWSLWYLGHYVDRTINAIYGYELTAPYLGFFYYLAIVALIAQAVVLLVAAPGLKAHKKVNGWNLLFYSVLLQAGYGVVRTFSEVGGGVAALFWTAVSAVIAAYFVFQIREHFIPGAKGKHVTHK